MIRLYACLLIGLAGCSPVPERESEGVAAEPNYYESSGTVYFISADEISTVKSKAAAGDNIELERLIDYYMFSHEPQDGDAATELQRWQQLGAERGLKGAAHNLLYLASAQSGPDCLTLKKHSRTLTPQELQNLREHNSYLNGCLSE